MVMTCGCSLWQGESNIKMYIVKVSSTSRSFSGTSPLIFFICLIMRPHCAGLLPYCDSNGQMSGGMLRVCPFVSWTLGGTPNHRPPSCWWWQHHPISDSKNCYWVYHILIRSNKPKKKKKTTASLWRKKKWYRTACPVAAWWTTAPFLGFGCNPCGGYERIGATLMVSWRMRPFIFAISPWTNKGEIIGITNKSWRVTNKGQGTN